MYYDGSSGWVEPLADGLKLTGRRVVVKMLKHYTSTRPIFFAGA